MPEPQPIVMEGSPVVRALDDAWATIRHYQPDLPEVCIVVRARSGPQPHLRHRHPAAIGWQRDDQRLSEICVDGDGLRRGAVVVLGTLLHEATHAVAQVRNIDDTSRRGRHNRRFAKLAEELGPEHDRRLRSTSSTPTTDSIARYRTALDNLHRALRSFRHPQPFGGGNVTSSDNPVACACDGGRQIRVSRTTLGVGPIVCQVCGSQFDLTRPRPEPPGRHPVTASSAPPPTSRPASSGCHERDPRGDCHVWDRTQLVASARLVSVFSQPAWVLRSRARMGKVASCASTRPRRSTGYVNAGYSSKISSKKLAGIG